MPGYRRYLGMGVLLLLGDGCLIDSDRCDAHQVKVHDENFSLCVCEPNAVFAPRGYGCIPCGENEEVQNGLCACKAGFSKATTDAACAMSQAGAACSATEPCGAEFPYCATGGYCSRTGCTTAADCPGGWSCELDGSTHFCRRPPTGVGVSCTSSADCAGFEANYCETLMAHTCMLFGCAAKAVTCPNEWACCDFSSLINIPFSFCITPAQLTDGECPMGGTRVTP